MIVWFGQDWMGSDFTQQGLLSSDPPVVILDQALASHLWPDESALGKRIKYGSADDGRWPWMEVVGVVGNTHHFSLDDTAEKGMYRPFSQEPMRTQTLVIRTAGDPLSLVVKSAERSGPSTPTCRLTTSEPWMESCVNRTGSGPRRCGSCALFPSLRWCWPHSESTEWLHIQSGNAHASSESAWLWELRNWR